MSEDIVPASIIRKLNALESAKKGTQKLTTEDKKYVYLLHKKYGFPLSTIKEYFLKDKKITISVQALWKIVKTIEKKQENQPIKKDDSAQKTYNSADKLPKNIHFEAEAVQIKTVEKSVENRPIRRREENGELSYTEQRRLEQMEAERARAEEDKRFSTPDGNIDLEKLIATDDSEMSVGYRIKKYTILRGRCLHKIKEIGQTKELLAEHQEIAKRLDALGKIKVK